MRTLKEKKNKQRGFTLVELLITIALIAGMVLIGSPSILRQLSHLRLTRATRDISVELQAARLKAIAQNIPYRVSFTLNTYPTSDTYRLQLFSGGSWQNDATRAPRDLPDTVDITSPDNFTGFKFSDRVQTERNRNGCRYLYSEQKGLN
jgi:type IV fimbrial biogenesis protein FimT